MSLLTSLFFLAVENETALGLTGLLCTHKCLSFVLTFSRPLNPPILGDLKPRNVPISPQSWGAGGAKRG